MEKYKQFEENNPDFVNAAENGNLNACFMLSCTYLGMNEEIGTDLFNEQRAIYWAEKCLASGTEEGLCYYAEVLNMAGYLNQKMGFFDNNVYDCYLKARDTILKLENSSIDSDRWKNIYMEIELNLGWLLVNKESYNFDPDDAKSHFSNVYSILNCSDALWGIGVVEERKNNFKASFEYGRQAIELNKWFDEERKRHCLYTIGLLLQSDQLVTFGIKRDLECSYNYISQAAKLGSAGAQQELKHYKRGLFGQLKYVK